MSEETATAEVPAALKEMGDKLAELTLKDAKALSDYLKDEHGIEAAAGGGAVMVAAGPDAGGDAPAAKSEFDVNLTSFGDKKLNVIKVVKNLTGANLAESKKLVEALGTLKEALPTEEAEKWKSEIEEAGGTVELK